MRIPTVLGLSVAVVACSSQGALDVDLEAPGSPEATPLSGSSSSTLQIGECPSSDSPEMSRVCMFDSKGKTYRQNGTLYVLPAAPPYGAQYHFKAGFAPLAADVSSEGPDASVLVYAAPYDVQSSTQCCSEDSEANRIAAQTELSASGVLTVTVTDAVPSGYQIAIILDFGALYRGRVSPAGGGSCDLPNQDMCAWAAMSGYAMRFYVGSTPSPSTPVSADAGACLLSYNTAFVDDEADPCCYRQGGKNQCDPKVQCNERSGGGCCLIYGTDATQGGHRCCLYATGGSVDSPAECAQLLASSR